VWTDATLDRRTRSLVTIAILGALRSDELTLHLKAAKNTGATPDEIAEVLMHVGAYAGIPAANTAFAAAKALYASEPGADSTTPAGEHRD
jgi:alkylhydroperoxidase/carboxymuconolactone decarboxylase family protein YurZ